MTKKDYELIAKALMQTNLLVEAYNESDSPIKYTAPHALELAVHAIANQLEKDNPRFQRPLFLEACGLKTEEVDA